MFMEIKRALLLFLLIVLTWFSASAQRAQPNDDSIRTVFANLNSNNTDKRIAAANALKSLPLDSTYHRLLLNAILQPFYLGDSIDDEHVENKLYSLLARTESDSGVSLIRQRFTELAATDERKMELMRYLGNSKNMAAIELLYQLLAKYAYMAAKDFYANYGIFRSVIEVPEIREAYYAKFRDLVHSDENLRRLFFIRIGESISMGLATFSETAFMENDILTYVENCTDKLPLTTNDSINKDYQYCISLMLHIYENGQAVDKQRLVMILSKLGNTKISSNTKMAILNTEVRQSLSLNKVMLEAVAADKRFRKSLRILLEHDLQLEMFPKKYDAPRYWGETALYLFLENGEVHPDDDPETDITMEFVEKRTGKYHGISGDIYVYRFCIGHDKNWMLGIAGLYNENGRVPIKGADVTGTLRKPFSESTLAKDIKELMNRE